MGVAAAIVGAGVVGAGATAYAANKAAKTQAQAAQNATNAQMQMFGQTQANLEPYNLTGQNALTEAKAMADKGFNFAPTMDQLAQTPGYQFTLGQGLKSVQNSAAARGLGTSGAAMRGAADYAGGLASNTYQQQFTNALNQWQTNYNSLMGLANTGEAAAAGVGNAATATGQGIAGNITGAANAQAAATMAMGNSIGGAANNSLIGYLYGAKNGLLGGSSTPNPYDAAWSSTYTV